MTTKQTAKQNALGQAKRRRANAKFGTYAHGREQAANEFLYSLGGRRTLRPYKLAKRQMRDTLLMKAMAIAAGIVGWKAWQPSVRA